MRTHTGCYLALSLILSASFCSFSFADTATPRVDARQSIQQERINAGVASGAITAREAYRLQNQQNRIKRMESNAKADGNVTRAERARITRHQNNANHRIFRQKHN